MTNQENDRSISDAMVELVRNPYFGKFSEIRKAQREVVIDDLCSDDVAKSERATMVAIGELRTYKSIIATYNELAIKNDFS